MKLNFIKNISLLQIHEERINSFRKVVFWEILLVLISLLLPEYLIYLGLKSYIVISEIVFSIVTVFAVFAWWDMLRLYTKSRVAIIGLFVIIVGTFAGNAILLNPIHILLTGKPYFLFVSFMMVLVLFLASLLTYITIREIFKNELPLSENLWGAVFVYLTMSYAFAAIYTLIVLYDPSAFPVNLPLGPIFYMRLLGYSFMVLGGLDNPIGGVDQLIINLATIEAVLGNLFIVFVVGRLFTNVSNDNQSKN